MFRLSKFTTRTTIDDRRIPGRDVYAMLHEGSQLFSTEGMKVNLKQLITVSKDGRVYKRHRLDIVVTQEKLEEGWD